MKISLEPISLRRSYSGAPSMQESLYARLTSCWASAACDGLLQNQTHQAYHLCSMLSRFHSVFSCSQDQYRLDDTLAYWMLGVCCIYSLTDKFLHEDIKHAHRCNISCTGSTSSQLGLWQDSKNG